MSSSPTQEPATPKGPFLLKVLRAEDVAWGDSRHQAFHSNVPALYLGVKVKEKFYNTKPIKELSPVWDETKTLRTAEANSLIKLTLKHRSSWKIRDVDIGRGDILLSDLLKASTNDGVPVVLRSYYRELKIGVVFLRIELMDPILALKKEVEEVKDRAKTPEFYEEMTKVVGRLKLITDVVDQVAALFQPLSVAWGVASVVCRAIIKQFETRQAVSSLAQKLSESLDFALDAKQLPGKLRLVEKSVTRLLNQITECCLFIQEYTEENVVEKIFNSDAQQRVDTFIQSLDHMAMNINNSVCLSSAIVTANIASSFKQIGYLEPCRISGRLGCSDVSPLSG